MPQHGSSNKAGELLVSRLSGMLTMLELQQEDMEDGPLGTQATRMCLSSSVPGRRALLDFLDTRE